MGELTLGLFLKSQIIKKGYDLIEMKNAFVEDELILAMSLKRNY